MLRTWTLGSCYLLCMPADAVGLRFVLYRSSCIVSFCHTSAWTENVCGLCWFYERRSTYWWRLPAARKDCYLLPYHMENTANMKKTSWRPGNYLFSFTTTYTWKKNWFLYDTAYYLYPASFLFHWVSSYLLDDAYYAVGFHLQIHYSPPCHCRPTFCGHGPATARPFSYAYYIYIHGLLLTICILDIWCTPLVLLCSCSFFSLTSTMPHAYSLSA